MFVGAPYVPSMPREVRRAFDELYVIGREDVLVDIGSGDGVVLAEAAKRGAKAVGYEINPLLVVLSRIRLRKYSDVRVELANFWRHPLPDDTTVVYVFGDGRDIKRMYDKVADESTRLGRELWLVSYGFDVPGVGMYKQVGAHVLYKCAPLRGGA